MYLLTRYTALGHQFVAYLRPPTGVNSCNLYFTYGSCQVVYGLVKQVAVGAVRIRITKRSPFDRLIGQQILTVCTGTLA